MTSNCDIHQKDGKASRPSVAINSTLWLFEKVYMQIYLCCRWTSCSATIWEAIEVWISHWEESVVTVRQKSGDVRFILPFYSIIQELLSQLREMPWHGTYLHTLAAILMEPQLNSLARGQISWTKGGKNCYTSEEHDQLGGLLSPTASK